jgi:nitrite reductase (NO-forming)
MMAVQIAFAAQGSQLILGHWGLQARGQAPREAIMNARRFYLALCVFGLLLPNSFFLPWFRENGLNPGLFVYHCATPMVAQHMSNGMYGMILVEPEGGLPPVDREFYVMQGEIYTTEALNQKGADTFSQQKLLDERPEYFVFNGAVGALTQEHPLKAKVGEMVRIFFGVGGPNFTSSFHVIGEIFDRVYEQASLTAKPLTDVQTTLVPTGGATVVEFTLQVPGRYILVDHSLSRMERGLAGYIIAEGPAAPELFDGKVTAGSGH